MTMRPALITAAVQFSLESISDATRMAERFTFSEVDREDALNTFRDEFPLSDVDTSEETALLSILTALTIALDNLDPQ